MTFVFGNKFRIRVFGKSHSKKIGVVISGVPRGLGVSEKDIQSELDKRRPGQSDLTTTRNELDQVKIVCGIENGTTTGGKIQLEIENRDVDSKTYAENSKIPRPGHADFSAIAKFGGKVDLRGGGFFSGRMTACFVMAGAVAKAILRKEGIETIAFIRKIGSVEAGEIPDKLAKEKTYLSKIRCPEENAAEKMEKAILDAKAEGDSLGGVIECRVIGMKAGLGEPMFGSIESRIAQFVFAIPATKGIEFGSGFKAAEMKGSEHNDRFAMENGKVVTLSNNAGGILGGISNGMPIVFRVAFKPTSSIAKEQETLNLDSGKMEKLSVKGRHDPCIAIRAVPVVESAAAICIADCILGDKNV